MTSTEHRARHARPAQHPQAPQQAGHRAPQWGGQPGFPPPAPAPGPVGMPQPPMGGWSVPQAPWASAGGLAPAGPPAQPPKKSKKWPWVVGALGVLFVAGSIGGGDETPASATAPVAAAPAAPAAASADTGTDTGADQGYGAQTARFGQQVEAGGVTVTAQRPQERSQEFLGTQYCSTVTLHNTGSSPESFSAFDWKFRTADGVEATANIPFNADKPLNSGSLRPGGTVKGEVCTDTQTTGVTEAVYSPGFGIMHEVTFTR